MAYKENYEPLPSMRNQTDAHEIDRSEKKSSKKNWLVFTFYVRVDKVLLFWCWLFVGKDWNSCGQFVVPDGVFVSAQREHHHQQQYFHMARQNHSYC